VARFKKPNFIRLLLRALTPAERQERHGVVRDRFIKAVEATGHETCPTCGGVVRPVWRSLYAQIGAFLVRLVGAHEAQPGWQDHRSLLPGESGFKVSSDAAYLVHWGLAERRVEGKKSLYRPTKEGIALVKKGKKVPIHALILHNQVHAWGLTEVTINEILGEKFDLDELLGQ